MIAKTELIQQKEFQITGISVRTHNADGQSQKDIGALWTRFINDELIHEITDKVSDDIYCVYTDYETDHTGCYTTVLGCKVTSASVIPDGFMQITIPEGKNKIYYLSGQFPQKVAEAWQEIWRSNIDRAYTADYDLYGADPESFEATEVKIYLAVK